MRNPIKKWIIFLSIFSFVLGFILLKSADKSNFILINQSVTNDYSKVLNFQSLSGSAIKIDSLKLYFSDSKAQFEPILGKWSRSGDIYSFKSEYFYPTEYTLKGQGFEYRFKIRPFMVRNSMKDCYLLKSKEEKYRCANSYIFTKALNARSVKTGLQLVDNFLREDINGHTYCHDITHNLGELATHIYPNYEVAASQGSNTCVEGYYHGLMESFQFYWDDHTFVKNMNLLCEKYTPSIDRDSCYHGVGHMVLIRSKNNFAKAVGLCKKYLITPLGNGDIYRPEDSCISGVAMAWGIVYTSVNSLQDREMYPNSNSPIHICDQKNFDELNLQACYADILNVYYTNPNYLDLGIKACRTLNGSSQVGCYQSLAMYMQLTPGVGLQEVSKACASAKLDKAMWRCFSETITTLMGTVYPHANSYFCAYSREIGRYSAKDCAFILRQRTS